MKRTEIEARPRDRLRASLLGLRRSKRWRWPDHIPPRTRPRIKKKRAQDETLYLAPACFGSLLRVKHVSCAQELKRSHADKDRPGTGKPDAHTAAWQGIRVGPPRNQMTFGPVKVFGIERTETRLVGGLQQFRRA